MSIRIAYFGYKREKIIPEHNERVRYNTQNLHSLVMDELMT